MAVIVHGSGSGSGGSVKNGILQTCKSVTSIEENNFIELYSGTAKRSILYNETGCKDYSLNGQSAVIDSNRLLVIHANGNARYAVVCEKKNGELFNYTALSICGLYADNSPKQSCLIKLWDNIFLYAVHLSSNGLTSFYILEVNSNSTVTIKKQQNYTLGFTARYGMAKTSQNNKIVFTGYSPDNTKMLIFAVTVSKSNYNISFSTPLSFGSSYSAEDGCCSITENHVSSNYIYFLHYRAGKYKVSTFDCFALNADDSINILSDNSSGPPNVYRDDVLLYSFNHITGFISLFINGASLEVAPDRAAFTGVTHVSHSWYNPLTISFSTSISYLCARIVNVGLDGNLIILVLLDNGDLIKLNIQFVVVSSSNWRFELVSKEVIATITDDDYFYPDPLVDLENDEYLLGTCQSSDNLGVSTGCTLVLSGTYAKLAESKIDGLTKDTITPDKPGSVWIKK